MSVLRGQPVQHGVSGLTLVLSWIASRLALAAVGFAIALAPGSSVASATASGAATAAAATNAPPQARDWAKLAALPDWSGVWTPNMSDQDARIASDPVPWTPAAAAQIAKLEAAEQAGDPKGLFVNCCLLYTSFPFHNASPKVLRVYRLRDSYSAASPRVESTASLNWPHDFHEAATGPGAGTMGDK